MRIIKSASQFPDPPKLREEEVPLPELGLVDGEEIGVVQAELNTGDHNEYLLSDKVFDEFGQITRVKNSPGRNVRLLAYTTQDGAGNRLFQTVEQAEQTLNRWGQSIINKLMLAANRVNYEDAPSAEAATKSAEGKSEGTSSSK